MKYIANKDRYSSMEYKRCGNSGLKLPLISLGLWHNFGDESIFSNARDMVLSSFDLGITHFDLANNYGRPAGSAEENFGKILKNDLSKYRDELIISSKAGYGMWPGPYGDWGSRKYLISSLDQSLTRMGLEYVDIFYHHRPDPETPLYETMSALDQIVRSGKALYVGISNYYTPKEAEAAYSILQDLGTPCLINQIKFNMFDRRGEVSGLLKKQKDFGVGTITFSPLEKGILTNRYLNGIPKDSRIATDGRFLKESDISENVINKVRKLNEIAQERGQSLAQMSLAWNLSHDSVCSVLIGASKVSQIEECAKVAGNIKFSQDEVLEINKIIS